MPKSLLQRTTAVLRNQGFEKEITYQKVEYNNPWARRKIDLFHIIDVLVLDGGFLGIQVCGADLQPHIRKIRDEKKEATMAWLKAGGRVEIHAWRKLKVKRGGKAKEWKCKIVDVLLFKNEIYIEERVDAS